MSIFARISLANRGLVALIALVVTGFGAFAIPSLKQQLLPSLEFPAAFISAQYVGAGPEVVESQVTVPIENAIQGVAGLDKVTSTSSEGVAIITAQFTFGTDLEGTVNRLQTAINRIQAQLPAGVAPQVFAGSTDDLPAVVLAAGSAGSDERELVHKLRAVVVPELESIDGVRSVDLAGVRDEQVTIVPDPVKLAAAKLDPTAIGTALRANGITMPAGALVEGDKTLTVQTGTPIASVDELRDLYLTRPNGAPVKLGDVATVEQRLAPPTSYTRTNGQESIGVSVTAKADGNAVAVSQEIRSKLDQLAKDSGTQLTVIFDQAPFVERSIKSLSTEGLLGLVMAVLVILVFLLSVRSTLVTAVSIPLSVLVALIALWVRDYSLNLLTLGALTIAVGRVVDDSIVVLENIKRHLGYGEAKQHAILAGVREVAGAVTASTLTTVAVFAPIALVGGFVGQLFAPFAMTVTIALLASLVVSLTIIPVLAYWFLRPPRGGENEEAVRAAAEEKERRNPLQRGYLPVIGFATRSRATRWITVGMGLVVLMGTFALGSRLETNFIDDSGQDTLSISQEMPVATSLAATDAAAKRVEEVLAGAEGVKSYQVTVGGGNFFISGAGGSTKATYSVALTEGVTAKDVENRLRGEFDRLSGVGEITFGGGGGPGGGSANQLAVVVKSADQAVLAEAVQQVRGAMADTPDVTDVQTSLAESAPRLDVKVDRAAAARYGLTEQAVGGILAQAFRGSPLGQVTLGGQQEDVVLHFAQAPATADQLRAFPVGPVKLADIAEVTQVDGPVSVSRIDGDRSATVTGTAAGSNLGAATAALTERLDKLTLPTGASYEIGGVSADQQEAFAQLGLAVLAAIAIVFVIMVATFRSLLQPLILLVSIPFAATGAIGLLLATGTPLGVPALIGILMLVGIVVTNAIVLMDLINQYRIAGMGVREAVVEGGRRRLRPILMTAIATIFALLPMALGLTGEGGFISQPLAIVVIGGLISSTLLTLVLVPTLYTMVERTKEQTRERRAGRQGTGPAQQRGGSGASGSGGPVAGKPAGYHPTHAAGDQPAGNGSAPVATVLREATDQFEILRLPKPPRRPPAEPSGGQPGKPEPSAGEPPVGEQPAT